MRGQYLILSHDHLLLHLSKFFMRYRQIIRRCVVCIASVVKYAKNNYQIGRKGLSYSFAGIQSGQACVANADAALCCHVLQNNVTNECKHGVFLISCSLRALPKINLPSPPPKVVNCVRDM
jgi:hypothetical protein